MNLEKLITDTFTAHEPDAPDSERVLAGARKRIDRRRPVIRPLTVAAGVVALTVAGVTVIGLNRTAPTPGDTAAPATSTATAPAVDQLRMPFTLGWLPPGEVTYTTQRISVGGSADSDAPVFNGDYMLSVRSGERVLNVVVTENKQYSLQDAVNSLHPDPGRRITIGGRRAVESTVFNVPEGFESSTLYVERPDRSMVYVLVSAQWDTSATQEELSGIARRIAENLQFPGTTVLTPEYGLGELPDGIRMCAFSVDPPSDLRTTLSTSYLLGSCETSEMIVVSTPDSAGKPEGTPGEPVQGHETLVEDQGKGYHVLTVLDAVDGRPVHLSGAVPVDTLHQLGEGLVLPD